MDRVHQSSMCILYKLIICCAAFHSSAVALSLKSVGERPHAKFRGFLILTLEYLELIESILRLRWNNKSVKLIGMVNHTPIRFCHDTRCNSDD